MVVLFCGEIWHSINPPLKLIAQEETYPLSGRYPTNAKNALFCLPSLMWLVKTSDVIILISGRRGFLYFGTKGIPERMKSGKKYHTIIETKFYTIIHSYVATVRGIEWHRFCGCFLDVHFTGNQCLLSDHNLAFIAGACSLYDCFFNLLARADITYIRTYTVVIFEMRQAINSGWNIFFSSVSTVVNIIIHHSHEYHYSSPFSWSC